MSQTLDYKLSLKVTKTKIHRVPKSKEISRHDFQKDITNHKNIKIYNSILHHMRTILTGSHVTVQKDFRYI